jgi:hypothetical protein
MPSRSTITARLGNGEQNPQPDLGGSGSSKTYAERHPGSVGAQDLQRTETGDRVGRRDVGRLRLDGNLSGHFRSCPGLDCGTDRFLGTNVPSRRLALSELRGIRSNYLGTYFRERASLAPRIDRAAGSRSLR